MWSMTLKQNFSPSIKWHCPNEVEVIWQHCSFTSFIYSGFFYSSFLRMWTRGMWYNEEEKGIVGRREVAKIWEEAVKVRKIITVFGRKIAQARRMEKWQEKEPHRAPCHGNEKGNKGNVGTQEQRPNAPALPPDSESDIGKLLRWRVRFSSSRACFLICQQEDKRKDPVEPFTWLPFLSSAALAAEKPCHEPMPSVGAPLL